MLHPLMPFITEEIWQKAAPALGITGETIMLQPYPAQDQSVVDPDIDREMDWVKNVIIGIRNIRGELNISPAKSIPLLLAKGNSDDQQLLEKYRQFLVKLAKLDSADWLDDADSAPPSAMQVVGDMEVLVPMAGLVDVAAELARLDKEKDKLDKEIARLGGKLGNAKFVDNAPPEVVAKEKEKMSNAETTLKQLQEQMDKLQQL